MEAERIVLAVEEVRLLGMVVAVAARALAEAARTGLVDQEEEVHRRMGAFVLPLVVVGLHREACPYLGEVRPFRVVAALDPVVEV